MMELPLIFLGGILGSGHCVGMCGAFAIAIGWDTSRPVENAIRQGAYSAGRISTYGFLGAVAGFCGLWLQDRVGTLINIQSVLSVVAGVALVLTGLAAVGLLPISDRWLKWLASCPATGRFRELLQSRRLVHVFLAGVATGFLPCGLVYGVVALALSTGHMLHGALVMTVFGLGTVPLLVLTGVSGSLLSLSTRTNLLRAAALGLVFVGVQTTWRGAAHLLNPSTQGPAGCPFCAAESQNTESPSN